MIRRQPSISLVEQLLMLVVVLASIVTGLWVGGLAIRALFYMAGALLELALRVAP